MDLDGARVLLTGATGGIGQAIARALTAQKARLVVTGRNPDLLESIAGDTGAVAVAADLSDRTELSRLVAEAGPIDILVANAGIPASGPALEYAEEQIDRALDVNLRAPIQLARMLVPAMVARGAGHIVLMSSLSGKAASIGTSMYSATKFGLRGYGLGLREDLRPHGVGVSVVFPGFISDAGMFADTGAKLPPGVRTSTPDQVARAVIRAIERNRAETDVAPLSMRLGTNFAQVAPSFVAAVQRRLGAAKIATAMADSEAHRSKR